MSKVKPVFGFDIDEVERFKEEVETVDYKTALALSRRPRDAKGHSETISFRVHPLYTRLASELQAREPAFKLLSDVHRTAYRLGCGVILKVMKAKGKIGDEADDTLLTIDRLNKEAKSDQVYREWEQVIRTIPHSLRVYRKDRDVFRQKIQQYRKEIESLKAPFWRDRLMKQFKAMVRSVQADPYLDSEEQEDQADCDLVEDG